MGIANLKGPKDQNTKSQYFDIPKVHFKPLIENFS